MNKGILRMTTEAVKKVLNIDKDIDIMGAEFEIDIGVVKLLLTTDNTAKLYNVGQAEQIPTVTIDQISTDECLYETILKEDMTYGEAQDAMSSGHCVARKVWKGYWYQEDITGFAHPVIVAKLKGTGEKVVATPYQEDRFANDWMIVVPKQTIISTKVIDGNYDPTRSEVMASPIQARDILSKFEGKNNIDITPFLLDLNYNPKYLIYLQSHKLIEIYPFAEAQVPMGCITKKGQTFLNKIREFDLIRG